MRAWCLCSVCKMTTLKILLDKTTGVCKTCKERSDLYTFKLPSKGLHDPQTCKHNYIHYTVYIEGEIYDQFFCSKCEDAGRKRRV
jgi:hypothetical protein